MWAVLFFIFYGQFSEKTDTIQMGKLQNSVNSLAAFDPSLKVMEILERVDTDIEVEYIRNDGILPYVFREIIKPAK